MKITKMIAVAAIAGAATTASAGNPTMSAGDDSIVIIPAETMAAGSSLGSLGGAAPALIGLLVLGAVAAGSGS